MKLDWSYGLRLDYEILKTTQTWTLWLTCHESRTTVQNEFHYSLAIQKSIYAGNSFRNLPIERKPANEVNRSIELSNFPNRSISKWWFSFSHFSKKNKDHIQPSTHQFWTVVHFLALLLLQQHQQVITQQQRIANTKHKTEHNTHCLFLINNREASNSTLPFAFSHGRRQQQIHVFICILWNETYFPFWMNFIL